MNIIKGSYNRIRFLFIKYRLRDCGKHTLLESAFKVEGAKYISIGDNVRIKPGLLLAAIDNHMGIKFTPSITIGTGVSINYDVHIACINRVEIGDGTLLASKVFITDHFHGDTSIESRNISPSKRILTSKGPVIIGENVWIGEGAAIMPGVTIGNNAIIGANSVVTKSIPAFAVAAGVPAKIIQGGENQ